MKKLKFTLLHILSLFLIGFIIDAHAADTYDPSTQILSIPQVVVNNNTYGNVILKLKDFEVLRVDPPAPSNPNLQCIKSDVTQAKMLQVAEGMKLDQVNNIMGCSGKQSDIKTDQIYYVWEAPGSFKSFTCSFDRKTGSLLWFFSTGF